MSHLHLLLRAQVRYPIATCERASDFLRAAVILAGLFVYDIFWVFYSERFFGENVMVTVAQKAAQNPVQTVAQTLRLPIQVAPTLQLPVKLLLPSLHSARSRLYMLGLGDIALPGMLVVFASRFEQTMASRRSSTPPAKYTTWTLLGYALGLAFAMCMSARFFMML